jgi:hypothetical protein
MPNANFRSVGLPVELANEIAEIAAAESRKKCAVVRRAIDLYRQHSRLLDEELTLADARNAAIANRQYFVETG